MEIKEAIGDDNIFIFGLTADQVTEVRRYSLFTRATMDPQLKTGCDSLRNGYLGAIGDVTHLLDTLNEGNDHYMISNDFGSYLEAQKTR